MKSRGSQIDLCWENHLQVPITVSAELLGLLLCAESCRKSQQSRISRKTPGASACSPSQKETTKTIALLAVRLLQVPGGTWKWNVCVRQNITGLSKPLSLDAVTETSTWWGSEGRSVFYTLFSHQLCWNRPSDFIYLRILLKVSYTSQIWAPKIMYHFGTSLRKC